MDSIGLRLHAERDHLGKWTKHGDVMRNMIRNSDSARKLTGRTIDYEINSIHVDGTDMTMEPLDYMVKQFHWSDSKKKSDLIGGSYHVPSSHYNVGYRVNIDKGTIDFSMSIPKWCYGHSVAQFCVNPHFGQTGYNQFYDEFKKVSDNWYDLFVKFVKMFFRQSFAGMDIDYAYVEVTRLDLAFNQYFKNKKECLQVAHLMSGQRVESLRGKRGRKEYKETDLETIQDEGTGFSSISRTSYYKVYHKGSEFKKNDAKRLAKLNSKYISDSVSWVHDDSKRNNKNCYDIESLQNEADLILRHELRFYPKTLSRDYKYKILPTLDHRYKVQFKRFQELDKKRKKLERLNGGILTPSEYTEFTRLSKLVNARHRWFLKDREYSALEKVVPHVKKRQVFSRTIMNHCINKFEKIINDVQVKEFPLWETLEQKVHEYNDQCDWWNTKFESISKDNKKKISLVSVRRAYDIFERYGSLDKAFDKSVFSPATFYRYKKMFSQLGLSTSMTLRPIDIDVTFKTYFSRIRGSNLPNRTYDFMFSHSRPTIRTNF